MEFLTKYYQEALFQVKHAKIHTKGVNKTFINSVLCVFYLSKLSVK